MVSWLRGVLCVLALMGACISCGTSAGESGEGADASAETGDESGEETAVMFALRAWRMRASPENWMGERGDWTRRRETSRTSSRNPIPSRNPRTRWSRSTWETGG